MASRVDVFPPDYASDCPNCARWAEVCKAVVAPQPQRAPVLLITTLSLLSGAVAAVTFLHLFAKVKWG